MVLNGEKKLKTSESKPTAKVLNWKSEKTRQLFTSNSIINSKRNNGTAHTNENPTYRTQLLCLQQYFFIFSMVYTVCDEKKNGGTNKIVFGVMDFFLRDHWECSVVFASNSVHSIKVTISCESGLDKNKRKSCF